MAFEVGDRVLAEKSGRRSRSAGAGLRTPRHGIVEEVLRGDPRPRYRIRWDVGEVSIFSPANSSLHPDPGYQKPKASEKQKSA